MAGAAEGASALQAIFVVNKLFTAARGRHSRLMNQGSGSAVGEMRL